VDGDDGDGGVVIDADCVSIGGRSDRSSSGSTTAAEMVAYNLTGEIGVAGGGMLGVDDEVADDAIASHGHQLQHLHHHHKHQGSIGSGSGSSGMLAMVSTAGGGGTGGSVSGGTVGGTITSSASSSASASVPLLQHHHLHHHHLHHHLHQHLQQAGMVSGETDSAGHPIPSKRNNL
ncbi:GS homeobox 2-like, partial [Anopheles nili]|uniref:GS homeobox 2-like n=1 Tax=Anopheles nili TaxID=185578 RepID=UPI00237C4324